MTLNGSDVGWQLCAGAYFGLLLVWFLIRLRRIKKVRQLTILTALSICVLLSFLFGNWTVRITAVLLCVYGMIRFAPDETAVLRRGAAAIMSRFGAAELAERVWSVSNDDTTTTS